MGERKTERIGVGYDHRNKYQEWGYISGYRQMAYSAWYKWYSTHLPWLYRNVILYMVQIMYCVVQIVQYSPTVVVRDVVSYMVQNYDVLHGANGTVLTYLLVIRDIGKIHDTGRWYTVC